MYPLNIVLAGSSEAMIGPVRQELLSLPATIEAEFTSVPAVLASMSPGREGGAPRLFILALQTGEDFQYMRKLRENHVGQPIMALVPNLDDPIGILAAQRSGAAQVVPLPFDADDLRAALDCIALMFGFPASENTLIAVCGVTGGCGATTLATNLAWELASQKKLDTALVELSFQMGMVATYMDLQPKSNTYDLLTNMERVDLDFVKASMTRVTKHLSVLAGPQHLVAPREVVPRDVLQLLDFCKRLARVVVIDLPCTYDDMFFDTLASVDHMLVVAEQKLPSIRAMKVLCDTMERDMGVSRGHVQRHLVINRFSNKDRNFALPSLEKILGATNLRTIANDHQAVSAAINNGKPLRATAPKSRALADIEELVEFLTRGQARRQVGTAGPGAGSAAGAGADGPSVFSRIRRAIGLM